MIIASNDDTSSNISVLRHRLETARKLSNSNSNNNTTTTTTNNNNNNTK